MTEKNREKRSFLIDASLTVAGLISGIIIAAIGLVENSPALIGLAAVLFLGSAREAHAASESSKRLRRLS